MADFFRDLRALRIQAGLSIDELAERAHFPVDILKAAEKGPKIPPNPVVVAFVRACGGSVSEWEDRWRAALRKAKGAGTPTGRVADTKADTEPGTAASTTAGTIAGAKVDSEPGTAAGAAAVTAAGAATAGPAPAADPGRTRGRRRGRQRLSRRQVAGIAAASLLLGGGIALLASQAGHIAPGAAPPHTPKSRSRHAPAPSRSSAPRMAAWPEVAGVGCPHTTHAAIALDAATQGPAWQGAGGGWAGNGCDGSSVWTMNPNGRELRPSAMSWSFSPQGRVSRCTLSVFVPTQNALGRAGYSIHEGSTSLGSVTVDQAPVAGQWVTLGTFPATGPAVEIKLMPVVASLTALDYGLDPGRPPHGHNAAVAASAAAMTCA